MTERDDPGIRAFIAHIGDPARGIQDAPRAAAEARMVTEMLDAGFEVLEFWGPEQMDVWLLQLTRRKVIAQFGIERGFSDGVHFGGVGITPPQRSVYAGPKFEFMHYIWALRTGVPQPEDASTHQLQWRHRPGAQSLSEWRSVIDWLDEATPNDVAAINRSYELRRAWINSHCFMPTRTPSPAQLREGARELEESARS